MAKRNKTGPEGSRQFVVTLFVHEVEGSIVYVEEAGVPNVATAQLPAGLIGMREGLRVGGKMVREFYANRQRELELKERAADLKKRQGELANARLEARKAAAIAPKKKEGEGNG